MKTPLCTGGPISFRSKFCLQTLKTTEYQLSNDVIAASFCSENKSMSEKFGHLNPQPKNIQEQKSALTKIWDELLQDEICKSITDHFQKASASVCKCRRRTFRAFTVAFTGILLTDFI